MGKIINYDFQKQQIISIENVEPKEKKEERLDPVLQRVKDKMDPQGFEMYKKTIDHWMKENFLYQMEQAQEDGEWPYNGEN